MKIDFEMTEMLSNFTVGMVKVVTLMVGSGGSLWLAQAVPDELSVAKMASGLTGWGLAVAAIVVLARTVKHLFNKHEEKDKAFAALMEAKDKEFFSRLDKKDQEIAALNKAALDRAEEIAEERLAALKDKKS